MKLNAVFAAAMTCLGAASASAQSSVRIYGILDTGVEYAKRSDGVNLTRLMQTAHVPTRLGFEGSEDLGGGLKAGFRLEQGFAVDTGNLLQGGRAFGREAFVSLATSGAGEVRMGRQYSVMQTALAKYDPDHLSPYSPVLAMQLSNIEQTSQDNVLKYQSPSVAGFSGTLAVSLGEGAAVAAGSAPQVVGAGVQKRAHGAMLEYDGGPLIVGLGYQDRGQSLNAGGETKQKMTSLGAIYDFGSVEVGALYWQHRNELPNGKDPKTTAWTVGSSWRVMPALRLVAQLGRAKDNGMAYATGATKARGESKYLNVGATYDFSKRTAVYTRLGRIADENAGFNGRGQLAAVTTRDAIPLSPNMSVRAVMVGLRHRF